MSRIVDILQAIQAGTSYAPNARSRAEGILKSIANNTLNPVTVPQSRYEEILSAIKGGRGFGNNLFETKLTTESTDYDISINGDSISATVVVSNGVRVYNTKRYEAGTYSVRADFENVPITRFLLRPFNANDEVISDLLISGWTWNNFYRGYFRDIQSVSFVIPNTVSSWQLGFCFLQNEAQTNVGQIGTISNIMLSVGTPAKPFEPYTDTPTAQTRLENILIAIANGTAVPSEYQSELEKAFIDAATNL